MENRKALNDNSLEQINGGMVAHLEQINGGMVAHLEEISGGDHPDPFADDSDHE